MQIPESEEELLNILDEDEFIEELIEEEESFEDEDSFDVSEEEKWGFSSEEEETEEQEKTEEEISNEEDDGEESIAEGFSLLQDKKRKREIRNTRYDILIKYTKSPQKNAIARFFLVKESNKKD